MSYLIAAYAITLGALVFYGISLAREPVSYTHLTLPTNREV